MCVFLLFLFFSSGVGMVISPVPRLFGTPCLPGFEGKPSRQAKRPPFWGGQPQERHSIGSLDNDRQ